MISAPNRSAWARISAIRSGPMMPSRWPGQFSTRVVSISCPPASSPSMSNGLRFALAVYSAAVSPAGPEPMMMTLRVMGMLATLGGTGLDVLVDQLLERGLVGEADDLLDDLTALEEQQRGDAANAEAH